MRRIIENFLYQLFVIFIIHHLYVLWERISPSDPVERIDAVGLKFVLDHLIFFQERRVDLILLVLNDLALGGVELKSYVLDHQVYQLVLFGV